MLRLHHGSGAQFGFDNWCNLGLCLDSSECVNDHILVLRRLFVAIAR